MDREHGENEMTAKYYSDCTDKHTDIKGAVNIIEHCTYNRHPG